MKLPLRNILSIFLVFLFVWHAELGLQFISNEDATGSPNVPLETLWGYGRLYSELLIIVLVAASPRFSAVLKPATPLYPFAAFALLSLAWAPNLKLSFRQCIDMVSLFLWISASVQILGLRQFSRISSLVAACVVIVSAAAALLPPYSGVHQATDVIGFEHAGKWRGIFGNKNSLGQFACMGFILMLAQGDGERLPWKVFWWTARACALACLIFSQSATSLLGCVVAVLVYGLLRYRATSVPLPLVLISTVGVLLGGSMISGPAGMAALFGRDATFTGRTEIWNFALQLVGEKFFVGHGINSSDEIFRPLATSSVFPSAVETHSAYLDVLFELGAIGLVLLICATLIVLSRSYKAAAFLTGMERRDVIIYIALLISACVIAIGETSPFRPNGYGAISFWLSLLVLCNVKLPVRRSSYVPVVGPAQLVGPAHLAGSAQR